jgi:oligoribonuclease NrnB/cAMP/cGMP phosphodiesterase (DHH superfamily)
MATALFSLLASIAPESAEILQKLQDAKLNEKQIMISLLALNLEQAKKADCILQEVRGLKGALTTKGVI